MMSPDERTADVAQPESEEWYRLLFKNAHDMIFVYEVTENTVHKDGEKFIAQIIGM